MDRFLTAKIQDLFGCIARVVYSQSHERFETAVKDQLFEYLLALEIQVVPELELEVTLAGVTRTTSGDSAPRDRQLLLRADAPSHIDHVAMEVGRILRLPQSQVATISVLLRSMNMKDAEDYLRVTHVSQLPSEEQDLLDGLQFQTPAPVVEPEPEDEERTRVPAETEPQDEAQREFSEGSAEPAESDAAAPVEGARQNDDLVDSVQPRAGSARRQGSDGSELRASTSTDDIAPSSAISQGMATTSVPSSAELDGSGADRKFSNRPLNSLRTIDAPTGRKPEPSGDADNERNGPQVNGAAPPTAPAANGSNDALAVGATSDNPIRPRAWPFQSNIGSLSEAENGASLRRTAASTKRPAERSKSGRLLSYTEPLKAGDAPQADKDSDPEVRKRKMAVEKAAVDYFVEAASSQWRDVTVIENPNNPGFDIQAMARDGVAEFIEVKGQSGAWTETGVAISPTQILKAAEQRERFWLCVVEYATDVERRQLYLVNNPFGLTDQFRFDKGWKGVASVVSAKPTNPKKGLFVNIAGEGKALITEVKGGSRLAKIDYQLLSNGQRRFNKVFQPNTMTLSVD